MKTAKIIIEKFKISFDQVYSENIFREWKKLNEEFKGIKFIIVLKLNIMINFCKNALKDSFSRIPKKVTIA